MDATLAAPALAGSATPEAPAVRGSSVTVRGLRLGDRAAWDALYAGYATFYKVDQTPEMRDRVWSWLHDPTRETTGFVAEDSSTGTVVGLAHFREFSRPLAASIAGYLDDLFVDPAVRGSGVGRLLIEAVAAEGRQRGWSVLRWVTAENNYRARSLYDAVGTKTAWVTYEIKT